MKFNKQPDLWSDSDQFFSKRYRPFIDLRRVWIEQGLRHPEWCGKKKTFLTRESKPEGIPTVSHAREERVMRDRDRDRGRRHLRQEYTPKFQALVRCKGCVAALLGNLKLEEVKKK